MESIPETSKSSNLSRAPDAQKPATAVFPAEVLQKIAPEPPDGRAGASISATELKFDIKTPIGRLAIEWRRKIFGR